MIYFLFVIFLYSCIPVMSQHQNINLFLDQKLLKNTVQTQQRLLNNGFKKFYFTTTDNIKLCGLLLDKSKTQKITHTIIYCAGFYPGNKEGMSSFYSLVADQPYNILLFDARGHNQSEGSLWSYRNLQKYGTIEHLDIIAAINFVHQYNQTHHINSNIIIHGICSGAFHTIKAIDQMNQHACPECNLIKGIIFDSGWLHISDIVDTTIQAEVKKQLQSSYFSWFTKPLTWFIQALYHLLLKKYHDTQPSIANALQKITIPIWFVHCINDPYIPIAPVQQCLPMCCNNNLYWWIKHDSHANYHMINHKKYQQKLFEFLKTLTKE